MKIIVEGDKKQVENLMKEKSLLVQRGLLSIEVLEEYSDETKKVDKEKPAPKISRKPEGRKSLLGIDEELKEE